MDREERIFIDFFVILVQIIFAVLKLTEVITWNWVYVLIPIMVLAVAYGAIVLIFLIASILDWLLY